MPPRNLQEQTFQLPRMARCYAWTVQVSPQDCVGCGLCVENCPGRDRQNPENKAILMGDKMPVREQEIENWKFFLDLPLIPPRDEIKTNTVKNSQLLEPPLFEFSGACGGCGETPYLKLATQLFGDRMIVANATGCSSIYGANQPTTPWAQNVNGLGPRLVKLPVRRQRRIWFGYAPDGE